MADRGSQAIAATMKIDQYSIGRSTAWRMLFTGNLAVMNGRDFNP
jgi:hypothetical protein